MFRERQNKIQLVLQLVIISRLFVLESLAFSFLEFL